MKATIHDFDVGPTEEEEAIAKAWVEQDPAAELESADVRDKLATAAAYGFAAGRAACSRGHDPRPVLLHEAIEKLNAAQAEILDLRALVGEEEGETLRETVERVIEARAYVAQAKIGEQARREEAERARIAAMAADYTEDDEGGVSGLGAATSASSFEGEVSKQLKRIQAMLVAKNEAYGDSALNPVRVFSRAPTVEQLKVRIDDKLSRMARGSCEETEDVELDLVGYLVLRMVARARLESAP